jgi:hypothetical protein
VTVTVDRRSVARHESGHVAGLIIACRWLPRRVTADRPAERILGQMELDWATEGLNPKLARGLAIAIVLGPISEGREDWPPAWPLDPDDGDNDARQLGVLADYLKLEEADWGLIVAEARVIATTPTFHRLVGLIGRALELADQLTADDIRHLIGARTCAAYGIDPDPTTKETDCAS